MTTEPPSHRGDRLALACVMFAALSELLIREQFYRMSIEVPAMVRLLGCWIMLHAGLLWSGKRSRRTHPPMATRVCWLLAVIISFPILLPLHPGLPQIPGWLGIAISGLLALASWQFARRLTATLWGRFQWALSLGSLLFVFSQPLFIAARAPNLNWPAWPKPPTDVGDETFKSAQIFLLLDELSANAANPVREALEREALPARFLSIAATGNGTAKVIPSMFSGGNFEEAKPCGRVSTCSGVDVLDFSKVTASRDDIDIAGFYMPYCAIAGLRSCSRIAIDVPWFDWRLWACAAFRRIGHFPKGTIDKCAEMQRTRWQRLREEVESAMWRAPVWRDGGFLFAHLPLPHPPAGGRSAPLKDDYAVNVALSARLVERIVQTARKARINALSLVIFSDHPLRTWHFCQDPVYQAYPCKGGDGLNDTLVPLIVAGDPVARTDRIRSNKDVFSLVP